MHALRLPPVSYSQLDSLQISFVPVLALFSSLGGLIQSAKWKERCVLHLLYWFVRSTEAEAREAVAVCGWKRGMKGVNGRQTLLFSGNEFLGQTSLTCKISPLVLPLSGFSL